MGSKREPKIIAKKDCGGLGFGWGLWFRTWGLGFGFRASG